MVRPVVIGYALLAACGSNPNLLIGASVVGSGDGRASAAVAVGNADTRAYIGTASVTINGVPITYHSSTQLYTGDLDVQLGEPVKLAVNAGRAVSASVDQFTQLPGITAPAPSAQVGYDCVNLISWSPGAPTADATYVLGLLNADDPATPLVWPGTHFQQVPLTQSSYSVPARTWSRGDRLLVVELSRSVAIPGADPRSSLTVAGIEVVPIAVGDPTLDSLAVMPANPAIPRHATQYFTTQ